MEEEFYVPARECQEATRTTTHEVAGGDAIETKPIIFRNSRFFIAWLLLFGVAGIAIALGMTVLGLQEIVAPRDHLLLLKAMNEIPWGRGTFYAAWLGVGMWRAGLQMRHYEARLDERGVGFRLGSRKEPCLQFSRGTRLLPSSTRCMPTDQYYAVIGKDRRVADFTIYTFFRAKKLVRQIAAHAGQPIQEI